MGYELEEFLKKTTPYEPKREKPTPSSSEYLIMLYGKINELPTQTDIKGLLQKCVYSILTDENVEEEIQFICEIKNLLNQIRVACNLDNLEIIGLIDEIYRLAVDKKLEEDLREQDGNKFVVDLEILALFENNYRPFEESEMVDEEGEEGSSEERNEEEDERSME